MTLLGVPGLVMALVVTGVLALAEGLEGPSLLPTGGAVLESVGFAVMGGVAGFVSGSFVRPR